MNGILYAMDGDGQPWHGSVPERDVLVLTSQQKDFLMNHLRLPIVILSAQQKVNIRPRRIFAFWRAALLGLQRLLRPAGKKILDRSRLTPEENVLCRELETQWRKHSARMAPGTATGPISVVMAEGRGLFPAHWLKNKNGDMLLLRRRHPLTRQSLLRVSHDRDNGEMAFASLMPGRFLTDVRP